MNSTNRASVRPGQRPVEARCSGKPSRLLGFHPVQRNNEAIMHKPEKPGDLDPTHPPTARENVIALDLPPAPLDAEGKAYFAKCEEKLGFVPNVLKAYAFDLDKLKAFIAMADNLMLAPSGLSKLEREMIAVVVSCANHCHYCLIAHGAGVRKQSNDPRLADTIAANYRAADLDPRRRAMLDFAWKMTVEPWGIEEADRARLRAAGFTDRDIWDIAAVAGFYNMSNRVANATDMHPNDEYYSLAR
jgi:uncharacterized peroxidase-related enzyme